MLLQPKSFCEPETCGLPALVAAASTATATATATAATPTATTPIEESSFWDLLEARPLRGAIECAVSRHACRHDANFTPTWFHHPCYAVS